MGGALSISLKNMDKFYYNINSNNLIGNKANIAGAYFLELPAEKYKY